VKTINCNNGWYLGLGDLICFAWLAAGCRATGEEIAWFATGWRAEVLRLLGVTPTDKVEGSYLTAGGFEAARHRGEKISYIEAMAREFGIQSAPLRPDIAQVPISDSGRVLLFPQTHGPSRQWPASHWIDLAWKLEAAGIETLVVLGTADERYQKRVPRWETGLSHTALFHLIATARLVISNDSGPAHVGGTLNLPSIAICGPTGEPTFRHYTSVNLVSAKSLGCDGCYYGTSFRSACELGCQVLFRTFPEHVEQVALGMLTPQHPEIRSQEPGAASHLPSSESSLPNPSSKAPIPTLKRRKTK
jgi:hypothetical protein